MDADERDIFNYLHTFGEQWVGAKEICRRAGGKKRFNAEPFWAIPVLKRMKELHVLEGDEMGRYRIIPVKHDKKERWVSPDVERILRESGVQVDIDRADAITGENNEPS